MAIRRSSFFEPSPQYVAVVIGFGLDDATDIKGPNVAVINETRLLSDADQEARPKKGEGAAKKKAGGRVAKKGDLE